MIHHSMYNHNWDMYTLRWLKVGISEQEGEVCWGKDRHKSHRCSPAFVMTPDDMAAGEVSGCKPHSALQRSLELA